MTFYNRTSVAKLESLTSCIRILTVSAAVEVRPGTVALLHIRHLVGTVAGFVYGSLPAQFFSFFSFFLKSLSSLITLSHEITP